MNIKFNLFPLPEDKAILLEKGLSLSASFNDSENLTEFRLASLLMNNPYESANANARRVNDYVKAHMPDLFKSGKDLSDSAVISKSNIKRHGKNFYYIDYPDHPEFSGDPWLGAISKPEILNHAIMHSAK